MVNIALPEDLRSMEGRDYIHDAEQGRQGLIGVEDARIEEAVKISIPQ